jgi:hypothetical protein
MKSGAVVHTCKPSTQRAEAGGQAGIHTQYQVNLGYMVRAHLRKQVTTNQKPKTIKVEVRLFGKRKGT